MTITTFSRAAIVPLLILASTPAAAKTAPAAQVQLLQPGDAQLSCQALATQINELALLEAKPKKKKGFGLGGLGKVLIAASPLGAMAGSGLAGQLATQAAGMAQQGAMQGELQGQVDAATAAANPTQSVEAQRKNRLMGFSTQKGC
jgi:hypothetical protein